MTQMTPWTEAARGRHRRPAWLLVAAALCLGLVACGGGGSSSGSDSGSGSGSGGLDISKLAVVKVTVNDAFGTPIAGATIARAAS